MKKKSISIIIVFILCTIGFLNINAVNAANYNNKFVKVSIPDNYVNYYHYDDPNCVFDSYMNEEDTTIHYDVYQRKDEDGTVYTEQYLKEYVKKFITEVEFREDEIKMIDSSLIENNGSKGMRIYYECYDSLANITYYQDEYYFLTDKYKVFLYFRSNNTNNYHNSKEKKDILKSFNIKDTVSISRGIPFIDVASDAWYLSAVKFCYENKMMGGMDIDYIFGPEEKLERGMLVTILWRMEGAPKVNDGKNFSDVNSNDYYYDAVRWASSNKIVSGYTGTTKFGPRDYITREDLAVMLRNYCKYKGKYVKSSIDLNNYSDGNKVSSWAKEAMQWAVDNKVVMGDQNKLNPNGNATRAENASMLLKYCINIK